MNNETLRGWLALPVIVLGMGALLVFGALRPELLAGWWPAALTGNAFIDETLKYQIVMLGLAVAVLAITYALRPASARQHYGLGELRAPATPVGWLGIKATDTWWSVGWNFTLIVSLATGAFVWFNVARGASLGAGQAGWLWFVPLFAAMNAFTEEAISRLSLVTALDGVLQPRWVYLLSALIFGLPHYFGVPGGWLGAAMAAFLGWLLARAVGETKGFGWAWFIHFVQDVIIFAGLLLVAL